MGRGVTVGSGVMVGVLVGEGVGVLLGIGVTVAVGAGGNVGTACCTACGCSDATCADTAPIGVGVHVGTGVRVGSLRSPHPTSRNRPITAAMITPTRWVDRGSKGFNSRSVPTVLRASSYPLHLRGRLNGCNWLADLTSQRALGGLVDRFSCHHIVADSVAYSKVNQSTNAANETGSARG